MNFFGQHNILALCCQAVVGGVIVTNLLILRQLYYGAKVHIFLIIHKKKEKNFRKTSNQVTRLTEYQISIWEN